MAVTGPLSWPLGLSLLAPSSSSLVYLLAFALGCALTVVVTFAPRKKEHRHREGAQRLPLVEKLAADEPAVYSVAPWFVSGIHRHQDSPEWPPVPSPPPPPPPPPLLVVGGGGEREREEKKKKKKKRGRKTKQQSGAGARSDGAEDPEKDRGEWAGRKQGTDCIYPFSSFSSATQRRIKHQYDQLVKSNQAKALTMAQVCEFANCLIAARNELQHKSEVIQRKFTISKALLFKADRSSFDRLCQQIHKLEAGQKRLEEDAVVYNRLQDQLKLSPAYKTLLELGSRAEAKASSEDNSGSIDPDFADISFEELLAQEKKDSFWQRNGKLRSCAS